MSNDPIFQKLAAERGYVRLLESIHRRPISNLFANRVQARVVTQEGLAPDPYLDGPMHLIEKEEEVIVRPFVPVQGIPRGTFVKTAGVPQVLLQGRTQEQFWEDVKIESHDKPVWLSGQMEHYRTPKIEKEFDPLDLVENGKTFGEFRQEVLEEFAEKYPNAENLKLSLKPGEDFANENQILVVEGRIPVAFAHAQETLNGILTDFRAAMTQQHPGHIAMAVTGIQEHEDGSATLEVEGQSVEIKNYAEMQQKLGEETESPVKPLSEKNTAQLME